MTNKKKIALTMLSVFAIVVYAMAARMVQADEESPVQQAEEMSIRTEALIERAENILFLSQESIEAKIREYDESLMTSKRLEYQHVTYSSRMSSSLEKSIAYATEPSYSQINPWNMDLRSPSSVTAYEIDEIALKGTALEGLGKDFVKAELEYGVNAMFLVSLAIHESGWGRSAIAKNKNNLFGFAAYDGSPYASATTFPTKGASVMAAAKLLSRSYLRSDAPYYGGGYTGAHVNKKYASDPNWSSKIGATMKKLDKKILEKQNLAYHEELYLIERGGDENANDTFSVLLRAQGGKETTEGR